MTAVALATGQSLDAEFTLQLLCLCQNLCTSLTCKSKSFVCLSEFQSFSLCESGWGGGGL